MTFRPTQREWHVPWRRQSWSHHHRWCTQLRCCPAGTGLLDLSSAVHTTSLRTVMTNKTQKKVRNCFFLTLGVCVWFKFTHSLWVKVLFDWEAVNDTGRRQAALYTRHQDQQQGQLRGSHSIMYIHFICKTRLCVYSYGSIIIHYTCLGLSLN